MNDNIIKFLNLKWQHGYYYYYNAYAYYYYYIAILTYTLSELIKFVKWATVHWTYFCTCRREHSAYDCYGWYRRFGARTAVCGHGYPNQHPCRTRNTRTYHQRDRRAYRWEGSSPSKGVSTWISVCVSGGMITDGCLLPRRKDEVKNLQ